MFRQAAEDSVGILLIPKLCHFPRQQSASRAVAVLHDKQSAFHRLCVFLMNSKVITPHWNYIGAALKVCSCILVSLSGLKISKLSSSNLLELHLKQKGFNSL